jgi:Tfp pilus assembly protein PilO
MNAAVLIFLRRHLFGVGCAAIALILIGVSSWLWVDIQRIKADLGDITQMGEDELETIANSPRLRQALALTHSTVKRIEANLAIESKLADNLAYFYNVEARSGSHIRGLNQLNVIANDAKKDEYHAIPYTLEVSGSYVQVMGFLQSLEGGPRLVKIRSFNLRPTVEGSWDVVLQLDLVMLGKS